MMSRLSRGALIGIAVGIAASMASLTSFGLNLEQDLGLEILFHLRGLRAPPPAAVVVSADRESADRLDLDDDLKKWPRSLHARLTEVLASAGAAVIAFDVFYEDASERNGDLAFAEALRNAKNVVLCERQQYEKVSIRDGNERARGGVEIVRRIPPLPLFAGASAASAPYPLPKVPVKTCWGWTFRRTAEDDPAPTLPAVAFQLYALPAYGDFLRVLEAAFPGRSKDLPRSGEEVVRTRGTGGMIRDVRKIFESEPSAQERMIAALNRSPSDPADPERRRILRSLIHLYGGGIGRFLNFYGPVRTIPTIPYHRALKIGGNGEGDPPAAEIAGKAVFIGSSESRQLAQKDGFYTVFTMENGVDLSGVEIAATAFANLVEDMPVRPLPLRSHVAVLVLWGIAAGAASFALRPAFAIPGVAALSLLYLAAAEIRFAAAGVWHPVVFPLAFQGPLLLMGAVAWSYVDLYRQRKHFRGVFAQYLPVEVVAELAENVSGLGVRTRLVNGICLATDAEHYTSLAESKAPKALAEFMNRYYEAVFDPVRRYGGMVSNVIGDSMLALWIATKEDPSPLGEACHAALEIDRALRGFRQSNPAGEFLTRIGLHYGEIFLGNIGAANRYEYRPVGDIVNTATRIEGLNKYLGTRILVSREVCSSIHDFLTRDMGAFRLAGKTKPVHVHELICRLEESSPRQRDCCARFSEGVDAFRRQSWEEASAKFYEALGIREGDGPSLFYLNLCARYSKSPPGDSWDGVVHMGNK